MLKYEELLQTVRCFTMKQGQQLSVQFDTGLGVGKLVYVGWGDSAYKDFLSKFLKVKDAYKKWKSDFVIFYLEGEALAVALYKLDEVDVDEKFAQEIYSELTKKNSEAKE